MERMTSKQVDEMFAQAPYTYASALEHLLGDGWHKDGWLVKNGPVTIDAKTWEIMWLDLAPDDEIREQRTVKLPTYSSIGATVAIAKALHEISVHDSAAPVGSTCGKDLATWPYGNCTKPVGHGGDCDRPPARKR